MIDDQERYRILRAAYDLSLEKGRPLSASELLSFYATTTGSSIQEENLWQSLKELERSREIKAYFFQDSEGTPRVQSVEVTEPGIRFIRQFKKRSWLTENRKWVIGIGIALLTGLVVPAALFLLGQVALRK